MPNPSRMNMDSIRTYDDVFEDGVPCYHKVIRSLYKDEMDTLKRVGVELRVNESFKPEEDAMIVRNWLVFAVSNGIDPTHAQTYIKPSRQHLNPELYCEIRRMNIVPLLCRGLIHRIGRSVVRRAYLLLWGDNHRLLRDQFATVPMEHIDSLPTSSESPVVAFRVGEPPSDEKWTEEEQKAIMEHVSNVDDAAKHIDWSTLAKSLNKTAEQLSQRYHYLRRTKQTNTFLKKDNERLKAAVIDYLTMMRRKSETADLALVDSSTIDWAWIGARLGKTSVAVHARWKLVDHLFTVSFCKEYLSAGKRAYSPHEHLILKLAVIKFLRRQRVASESKVDWKRVCGLARQYAIMRSFTRDSHGQMLKNLWWRTRYYFYLKKVERVDPDIPFSKMLRYIRRQIEHSLLTTIESQIRHANYKRKPAVKSSKSKTDSKTTTGRNAKTGNKSTKTKTVSKTATTERSKSDSESSETGTNTTTRSSRSRSQSVANMDKPSTTQPTSANHLNTKSLDKSATSVRPVKKAIQPKTKPVVTKVVKADIKPSSSKIATKSAAKTSKSKTKAAVDSSKLVTKSAVQTSKTNVKITDKVSKPAVKKSTAKSSKTVQKCALKSAGIDKEMIVKLSKIDEGTALEFLTETELNKQSMKPTASSSLTNTDNKSIRVLRSRSRSVAL